jgi:hypothetical protein
MKQYRFWLKVSVVFQLLTGVIHSLTFLNPSQPANDTEKQMLDLMEHYTMDVSAGFKPTMADLMTCFSICFTLLFFLGGFLNLFLLRKKAGIEIMKGVIGINVLIFGACFTATFLLTFLPPTICTGLIFISLVLAYWTALYHEEAERV